MKKMNNRGQMILVNLLIFVMVIAVLVALIPALSAFLKVAQQSDGLNCNGYIHTGDVNNSLSYNSSLETNTLACVAIRLYLPYIVIVILVGGVTRLLAGRAAAGNEGFFG